jgi:lipopolysaccharide biosynthesis regulator YciM
VIAAELAEIFLQRNTITAAENWATQARRLDANFSGAKILSGRIAEAAGKANDARDFYRSVPPGDPSYPQAQSRLDHVD